MALLRNIRFLVSYGVQGTFFSFARLIVLTVLANQRLHGWDERAWDHEKVVIENPDEIQKRIEARHYFAGLDP
jgi:hypothetical protein